MCVQLDEYQEQSYLLDPYLENVIQPPIRALRAHIKTADLSSSASLSNSRIRRLARLVYFFTKVRGYKTVVRFFPHEVDDLSILLKVFSKSSASSIGDESAWELRFVLLLWLSLVCMIPFDLHKFDAMADGRATAHQIEDIGSAALGSPGLDRDGASFLLGHFFLR
jgi:tubulin-specific chaperone D